MNDIHFDRAFRNNVETYLREHNLKRYELAERLHISPQLLSEILGGTKTVSQETKLQTLHSMDTQNTDDGLDQVNAAVLKRFAQKGMTIKYFQSGLGLSEGDGFVAREGASEPDYAEILAQLVRDGRLTEAISLISPIAKGAKVTNSTAPQAHPNPRGVTQDVQHVDTRNGRADVKNSQSFSGRKEALHLNSSEVADAKKEFQKAHTTLIGDTHNSTEKLINFSEAPDLEKVKRLHNENLNNQICKSIGDQNE